MDRHDLVVCPVCQDHAYGCDACMHAHLLRRHDVRYSEVFGPAMDPWTQLCKTHATCVGSMLGM